MRYVLELLRKRSALAQIAVPVCVWLAGCSAEYIPASSEKASCTGSHWVSVWQAPPTDGVAPVDASLLPFVTGPLQTVRAILSPTGSGPTIRVHLSNRFGITPLTIASATVARRTSGANIDASSLKVLEFNGQPSVTIPAGEDMTSDPLDFPAFEYQDLAVSMYARDAVFSSTHHHVARQTSYATLPAAGNQASTATAAVFVQSTTLRPFVTGLDVLVPQRVSTLLALGDSLTDGYQGDPGGVPQNLDEIDRNNRYPDFIRRRPSAIGRPIYLSNAGISGNQVLQDPQLPDGLPTYGPSLLKRLDLDAIQIAGISDVLFMEGINDIGQRPSTTVEALTAGYRDVIGRMKAAGFHIIQATLTPSGGYSGDYGSAGGKALRQAVNQWIRTQSPADAIVDFDAAVRDPSNPDFIDPRYDGGDGLHFNAAGYQRLADSVDLNQIVGSGCN